MTPIETLIQRLTDLEAKATKGPWDTKELQPHPSDGPNSLTRWSLFHEEFPDTAGKVGTGIVWYSCSTFAYLSADEANASLIAESRNALPLLIAEIRRLKRIEEAAIKEFVSFDGCLLTCPFQTTDEGVCTCDQSAFLEALHLTNPGDGCGHEWVGTMTASLPPKEIETHCGICGVKKP